MSFPSDNNPSTGLKRLESLTEEAPASQVLAEQAQKQHQHYLNQATADNTRRAYQTAIRQFERQGGLLPATEEQIAQYLVDQAATLNPRTLSLQLTALSHWHTYQRFPDPTQTPAVRKILTGIYREHGQPKRKAKALYPEHIRELVAHCQKHTTLKSQRDNALIQMAYFGAFRCSELVNLAVEHITFDRNGMLILIPHSKTDQTGEGKTKALPYGNATVCPVSALKQWLTAATIQEGFVFRSVDRWDHVQTTGLHPDSVSGILKTLARACGWEFTDQLSSHSFRRGFASSAAATGAEFTKIKRQGGWKSDQTVREYLEEGELFENNAADHLLKQGFAEQPKTGSDSS